MPMRRNFSCNSTVWFAATSVIGIILLSVSSVSAVSDLSPETSDVNDDLASTVDIYDSSSALQGDSIDLSNNQGSLCNVLPIADSNGNVLATADDELIGNDSAEEGDDSGDEEEPVNTSILDIQEDVIPYRKRIEIYFHKILKFHKLHLVYLKLILYFCRRKLKFKTFSKIFSHLGVIILHAWLY